MIAADTLRCSRYTLPEAMSFSGVSPPQLAKPMLKPTAVNRAARFQERILLIIIRFLKIDLDQTIATQSTTLQGRVPQMSFGASRYLTEFWVRSLSAQTVLVDEVVQSW